MRGKPVQILLAAVMIGIIIGVAGLFMLFTVNAAHTRLTFAGIAEGIIQDVKDSSMVPMGKVLLGYGITFTSAIGLIVLCIFIPEYLIKGIAKGSLVRRFCKVVSYEALLVPAAILMVHLLNPRIPVSPLEWFIGATGVGCAVVLNRLSWRLRC